MSIYFKKYLKINKLKIFLSYFFILTCVLSQPVFASGYASVSSGINISSSPVVLGKEFSISFTLQEVRGEPKTFENIAIAILDPNGNFAFDFAMYSNVTVDTYSSWSATYKNSIYTNRPTGTYKAVIRGKYAGSWFDFDTTSSGVTPKTFSVVAVATSFPAVKWNSSAYSTANIFWKARFAPKTFYSDGWSNLGDAKGNCTWYVHGRLRQLGYTVSLNTMSGNANTWANSAKNAGISVDNIPTAGAIAQSTANRAGYKENGHIAFVERVNTNGTLLISESSYVPGSANWDFQYRTRTVKSSEFNNYIHVQKP